MTLWHFCPFHSTPGLIGAKPSLSECSSVLEEYLPSVPTWRRRGPSCDPTRLAWCLQEKSVSFFLIQKIWGKGRGWWLLKCPKFDFRNPCFAKLMIPNCISPSPWKTQLGNQIYEFPCRLFIGLSADTISAQPAAGFPRQTFDLLEFTSHSDQWN